MKIQWWACAILLGFLVSGSSVHADSTWDGGGGNSLWSNANNWSLNSVPLSTTDVDFTGTGPFTIGLGGNQSVNSLSFSGSSGYTLNNNTLTLTSGSISVGSGSVTDTISSGLSLASSSTLSVGSGATLALNGGVSGVTSLTKSGSGTLLVETNLTAPTTTTISNGTLLLGFNGNNGSISGNIVNNSTLEAGNNNTATLAGNISGSGNLVLANLGGTLVLTGTNTYSGGTSFAGTSTFTNTLQIGNGGTTGSITGDITNLTNVSTVIFDRSDSYSYGGNITGSGQVTQNGAGTLTLSGTNTYSGGTNLNAGVLNFSSRTNLGSGGLNFNGGTLQWAAGNTADISNLTITIGAGGATFDTNGNAGAVILANAIGNGGSGGVTKVGGGLLILNAANTYGGATTVSAGTLQIANAAAVPGNLVDNAAVIFGASTVFSHSISGTGTLNVIGGDTLTLTGANSLGGTVTVAATAGLQFGSGTADGTWSGSGNIVNNGTLTFDNTSSTTIAGSISGGGSVTQEGAGTLFLTGSNTFTGNLNITTGQVSIGNGGSGGSLAANVVNGGELIFNSTSNVTYGGAISGSGVVTQAGTNVLTLTGTNTYTGNTNFNSGTVDFSALTNLGTGGALVFNGGALQWANGNSADISSRTVTLSSGGATFDTNGSNVTLAGAIGNGGSGSLTKIGSGILTLSGSNTYTGSTNFNGGIVDFSALSNLGAGTVLAFNGGTLQWAKNSTTDISSRTVTINAGGATLDTNGNAVTLANAIGNNGSGSLTKVGAGTLILVGANTYTGGTTISAGTLQLGNGGTTGTLVGNVTTTGNLAFDYGASTDFGGNVSGSGTVTNVGSSTVRLTGTNTFSGNLIISNGSVDIGNGGATGSITANVVDNGNLIFNRSADYSYSGAISGSGSLFKVGSNVLTLTGTNTYSGNTNFQGGTLDFSSLANLGSGAGGALVFNGGTLQWASGNTADISSRTVTLNSGGATFDTNGNNVTLAGAIGNGGSGSLTKIGSGTLTLGGANTYTGSTNLNAGTVVFSTLSNLGTGTGSGAALVFNGGTLQWTSGSTADISSRTVTLNSGGATLDTNGNNVTLAGAIGNNGSGGLTKAGSGTLTLAGANTYTGATTVSAGTLQISNLAAVPGGLVDNATVSFATGGTFGRTISGTGAVTTPGTGTLVLTGADSYTGGTTVSAGGTLQFGSGTVDGTLSGSGGIVNNGTLNFKDTGAATFAGVISGGGGVNQLGGGTLSLTGADTFTGNLTISNGSVSIGNSIAANVVDNGNLIFNVGNTSTYGGTISGSGTVEVALGATLTGSNTFTGGLTVDGSGNLSIGNGGTSGSISGPLVVNGIADFNRSDNLTYGGAITGNNGILVQMGTGTITLTGPIDLTGGQFLALGGTTVISNGVENSINLVKVGFQTGTGAMTVTGTGTVLDIPLSLAIADGAGGTLNITAGGAVNTEGNTVKLGNSATAAANLNITSGGTLTTAGIGNGGGSTPSGGITLDGGTIHLSGITSPSISSAMTLNSGGGTITTDSGHTATISSVIGGSGGLTVNGAGTLALTGADTFTGPLTISSGTLAIGNGGSSGSVTANIVDNGTLIFNSGFNQTYGGIISGSGSLEITNTGIQSSVQQTLTGTSTNTGQVTVAAGANLRIGNGGTTGSLANVVGIDAEGKVLFDRSDNVTFGGTLTGNNSSAFFEQTGSGTLTLTGPINSPGTLLAIGNGTLVVANGTTSTINGLDAGVRNYGAPGTMTISGSGTIVNDIGELSVGREEAGSFNLTNGAVLNLTAAGGTAIGEVSGNATVTMTISAGGVLNSAVDVEGSGNLILDNGTINFTSGADLGLSTTINSGGGTITAASGQTVTISGAISGSGPLTLNGNGGGTILLNGNSLYTGQASISNGTLQIGNANTSATFNGNIADNSALVFYNTPSTYSGVISGAGTVELANNETLTLTGNSTVTGKVTVDSNATLWIGTGGTAGSLAQASGIDAEGDVYFNRSDNITFAGAVTGTADNSSFFQFGSGTLTLTGPINYQGTLYVTGNGTLIIANGTSSTIGSLAAGQQDHGPPGTLVITGSGTVVTDSNSVIVGYNEAGAFTVTNGAVVNVNDNNDFPAIIGGGTVTVSAGGVLNLNGSLDDSGPLILDNGQVNFTSDANLNSATTLNSGGGTITTVSGTTLNVSGTIGGTGALSLSGGGTFLLTGANTYSGTTTLSSGKLVANNTSGSATGTGALDVKSGAIVGGGNGAEFSGSLLRLGSGGHVPSLETYAPSTVGIISGPLTLESGAHLAPGNSVGTLTIASLTLFAGSQLDYEFNATANDFTKVTASGGLTIEGGGFNLYRENTATAFDTPGTYDLIGYTGSLNGNITSLSIDNPQAGYSYQFINDGADGLVQLQISAVPEPPAWQYISAALLGVALFRRRRPRPSAAPSS